MTRRDRRGLAAGADPDPPEDDEDVDAQDGGIEWGAVGALATAAGTLALQDELEALGAVAVGPQDLAGVAEGWARMAASGGRWTSPRGSPATSRMPSLSFTRTVSEGPPRSRERERADPAPAPAPWVRR